MALMILVALAALFGILLIAPELNKISPDRAKLELYLGIIIFSASALGLGINLNALGFTSMIREKSRGNIQSLLATPLGLKDIWIGKSLAIFIPGLILGEFLTLISLIVVNYIYFVPTVGFVFNPWIAVTGFFAIPLIYFSTGLLVYLVGLTGKPVNANIIAQVFLPVYLNIIIQILINTTIFVASSWTFALANIGLGLVIAIIVIIIQFRISKEKVVLSY
jgi:ABC-type transport system involved in multi-copper enzyme maturation permease subunit